MTSCDRLDDLRDYAMGELAQDARVGLERHLAGCGECAAELEALQLTTTALRSVADREIPQRIAFVSDKVFEPSPVARWFAGFWNSAARLGFASACVLSAAVVFAVAHRPAAVEPQTAAVTVNQASISRAEVQKQIDEAVTRAVAQVRSEDAATSAKLTAAALAQADARHEKEHRALLVAMEENLTVMQKRLSTYTMLAANDSVRFGDAR